MAAVTYAMKCGHWEEPDLSPAALELLHSLARQATPSPWRRTGTTVWAWVGDSYRSIFPGRSGDEAGRNVSDQNFIVGARVMVPAMVEEIRTLRAQLAMATKAWKALAESHDSKIGQPCHCVLCEDYRVVDAIVSGAVAAAL